VTLAVVAIAALPTLRDLARGDVPVIPVRRGPFLRKVVAEGNLAPVKATPVNAPFEAQDSLKIEWLVPDGTRVRNGDVVIRFDPSDMVKNLADGRADEATAESRVQGKRFESQGVIRNLDRDADLARLDLDHARQFQSKDTEIFSRAEIIQSSIDGELASERMGNAQAVRGIREKLDKVDLDLLEIERRKALLKIDQAQKGLRAIEVRAPHDGILVYKRNWQGIPKVGDQVWPGMPLAEIPRLDAMEAQVYVLEADAGGLAVNRPATFILEGAPDRTYRAVVKSVSALAKPRAGWSPVQYFDVALTIEHTDPAVMKPGQRVQATLVLDDRKDVLTVPHGSVFERDGRKIVYRLNGWHFEPVEVTLGPTALGAAVVEKGIEEGDQIALRDPTIPAGRGSTQEGEAAPDRPAGPVSGEIR
jgi:multidrug efflux pump subunit AcrA (membrane-fusion protein)